MSRKIFISHSLGNALAKQIAESATEELGQHPSVEVFVDAVDIDPGSHWRKEIFEQLATCSGAVLILDAKALKSNWVSFEAGVLCWRHMLWGRPKIMPVLIREPGQEIKPEDWNPFSPFLLGEIQQSKIDLAPVPPEEFREKISLPLAQGIKKFFGEGDALSVEDPISDWRLQIQTTLEGLNPEVLEKAAKSLSGSAKARPGDVLHSDLPFLVANLILNADPENLLKAYRDLKPVLARTGKMPDFLCDLRLAWIPYQTAKKMLEVFRDKVSEKRNLILFLRRLNNDENVLEEAARFCKRAYLNAFDIRPIEFPQKIGAGDEAGLDFLAQLNEALVLQGEEEDGNAVYQEGLLEYERRVVADSTFQIRIVLMIRHNLALTEMERDWKWKDLQSRIQYAAELFPQFPRLAVVPKEMPDAIPSDMLSLNPISSGLKLELEIQIRADMHRLHFDHVILPRRNGDARNSQSRI